MRTTAMALLVLVGCRTPALESEQLYDRPVVVPADAAAAPVVDGPAAPDDLAAQHPPDVAREAPPDLGSAPDPDCPEDPSLAPTVCEPQRREAGFSGGVVDACDPNRTLNANVSLGGQRRCSGAGKGAFDFQLLQVGCKLTLVAAKPGYQRYCRVITAPRAGYTIRLERIGGCTAPPPGATACTCDEPGCMPHTGE